MRFSLPLTIAFTGLLFASCAGTRIVGNDVELSHPVGRIGTSAAGGEMADAIAVAMNESERCDAQVLDIQATLTLLKELGIPSYHASRPANMERMKSKGLDAYLRVETTPRLTGGDPGSIEVKLLSTHDPNQCVQFVWHNAWGGMPGSTADRVMRKGPAAAAKEIATELVRRLAPASVQEP